MAASATVMGNSSNPARAMIAGRLLTMPSATGSLPKWYFVEISQAETALTSLSLSSSRMAA